MYILTHLNLFPSARALRTEIENLSGYHFNISSRMGESDSLSDRRKRTIGIRWGNGGDLQTSISDKKLNDPRLIRVFANKKLFSDMFVNDFWVPIFRRDEPQPKDFPVLIRESMTGFGGRGIIACKDMKEFKSKWTGQDYWTSYVDLASEFRVHVFNGKVLRIFKKVRKPTVDESEFNIRNARLGWEFALVGTEEDSLVRLKKLACDFFENTCKKFKIDKAFFALDVGWNKKGSQYFILEGNTAPGIAENENTRYQYAVKFIEALNL